MIDTRYRLPDKPVSRVLIVDDDAALRMLMAQCLGGAGMAVHEAPDGEQALAAFADQPADLVLLDLMMPGMDGFQVCRALRGLPGGADVPVLVVTGLDDTESLERAYEAGATNFITKPINWPNLPHQVQYALRSSRAFAHLKTSEERYALAARGANDGLWDWDLETNEIYFSPRWKAMLGQREEAVGTRPVEWFRRLHPEDRGRVKAELEAHLEGNTPHLESEHRIQGADGSYRWVLCRGLALRDAGGHPHRMAGSQTDVTARKQAEEQLLHDAFHDALTGLPNRSLFMDRVAHRIQLARRSRSDLFAVVFMDLDRFKVVNDSLGHVLGDQFLQAVSERLRGCLRLTDTLARMGGDEFTVLLEDVPDVAMVTRVAERIQSALNEPFDLDGQAVVTTASIGIALSTTGYERAEDMLRDADTAMYRAKSLGKDRYEIFDRQMHAQAVTKLKLESELRSAIERHEFSLVYQPMVCLVTNELVGFEALLRWQHPSRGLQLPEAFLSLAEESGLIVPIGRWVVQEACRQMRAWQDEWPATDAWFVSVNISSREFAQPDFLDMIDGVLKSSGLSPDSLKIELTERVLIENTDSARLVLERLRERGIQISIDDFGTGYSSFSYLHQFPFDVLKIDRSFVKDLTAEEDKQEIVRAIVTLAHNLGMTVVAEGSEQARDIPTLRQLACEFGQGHVFAQPMEGSAVAGVIAEELAKKAKVS